MNEFMAIVQELMKYVNANNIEEFISMIKNLVQVVEKIKSDLEQNK